MQAGSAVPAAILDRELLLVTALGDEPLAPLALARQLGARHVACVGARYTEWRVEPLLALLRRDGRTVEWLDVEATDVPAALAELRERIVPRPNQSVVFDLTNARGVLGFALYELARRLERDAPDRCRVVRIDWSDRLLRSISPDRAAAESLTVRLGVDDVLAAHGMRLLGRERSTGDASAFGDAASRIAANLAGAAPLLDAVHRGAWDRPLRAERGRLDGPLVGSLMTSGVLIRRDDALFATNLRAFQFLHGRWLEEYLFEVAEASGRFDDCASGVRFTWLADDLPGADVANEIDFAGTMGGRATIASCKTGVRDVNGALYEVLTLAERAAGRSVITVFATTVQLDRYDRRRAATLGIRILDADALADPARVLAALADGTAPLPSSRPERQGRAARDDTTRRAEAERGPRPATRRPSHRPEVDHGPS